MGVKLRVCPQCGKLNTVKPVPITECKYFTRVSSGSAVARSYGGRSNTLRCIGFATYDDYLNSELWAGIRGVVLGTHPLCAICGITRATQVHHQSYKKTVMLGENLKPLVPVCDTCHRKIEFTTTGHKRTLQDAVKCCKKLLRGLTP